MTTNTPGESIRPVWKGFLRFSLVSIPVVAVNAKVPSRHIELHWLHKDCNQRIHYQKVCPVHGEVPKDEIVSGYQAGKHQYVIIEEEDLKKLRTHRMDTIHVDSFIESEQLNPLYFTDSNYYLLPDGEAGAKPYVVFQRSMQEADCYGIAQIVLFRKEQLVAVRPLDDLLVVTVLNYQQVIRQPETLEDQVPDVKPSTKEIALAKHLIDASTKEDFNLADYRDRYADKLMDLIEAKKEGQEYVGEEEKEGPPVALDFAEALKKSLAKAAKAKAPRRTIKAPLRTRHRKVS